MKHGLVRGETFRGYKLLLPPSRSLYDKIGLPVHETYRFVGYKSSIMRHLIDSGSCVVNGTNQNGFTVQVSVKEVMKSAGAEIADTMRAGALGLAGAPSAAIDMMNTVLDGISAAQYVVDMLPEADSPITPLSRPSRAQYLRDHALNSRIIVDLTTHSGERKGWIDTNMQEIDLKTIAYFVQAA